jgi:P pilus assembly chaperone PapD
MNKNNMKTMRHILDEFQDKDQVVVSIQNFDDKQQVLMSSFSQDGAFEKAYSINDPIIRCPTICDLHLIETLRPINSDTDTNPEEENPQQEPTQDVPREEEDKAKK